MSDRPAPPPPIQSTSTILQPNRACTECSAAKVRCIKSTDLETSCTRCAEKNLDCVYRSRRRPEQQVIIDSLKADNAEKEEKIAQQGQEIAQQGRELAAQQNELAHLRYQVACLGAELRQSNAQPASGSSMTSPTNEQPSRFGRPALPRQDYCSPNNGGTTSRAQWSTDNTMNGPAALMHDFTAADDVGSRPLNPFASQFFAQAGPLTNAPWNPASSSMNSPGIASPPSFAASSTSPSTFNNFFNPAIDSLAPMNSYAPFMDNADGRYATNSNNYDAIVYPTSDLPNVFSSQ